MEYTSFIENRQDFEEFPWEAAAEIDLSKIKNFGPLLPHGMKAIAVSGKLFTLSWILMVFNNFATKHILDEQLVADVVDRVNDIQMNVLEQIFDLEWVAGVWVIDDLAFGTGPMKSLEA